MSHYLEKNISLLFVCFHVEDAFWYIPWNHSVATVLIYTRLFIYKNILQTQKNTEDRKSCWSRQTQRWNVHPSPLSSAPLLSGLDESTVSNGSTFSCDPRHSWHCCKLPERCACVQQAPGIRQNVQVGRLLLSTPSQPAVIWCSWRSTLEMRHPSNW